MKKLSILVSVTMITALCFWALIQISADNKYKSVRKYNKPSEGSTIGPSS